MTLVNSTKRCPGCSETKNLAEFYSNKGGLSSRCKPCLRQQQRESQAKKREVLGEDEFRRLKREGVRRLREREGIEYEKTFGRARNAAIARLIDLHRREYEHLLDVAKREFDVEATRRRAS